MQKKCCSYSGPSHFRILFVLSEFCCLTPEILNKSYLVLIIPFLAKSIHKQEVRYTLIFGKNVFFIWQHSFLTFIQTFAFLKRFTTDQKLYIKLKVYFLSFFPLSSFLSIKRIFNISFKMYIQ